MNEFWWINSMDTNFNWIANHLIEAKFLENIFICFRENIVSFIRDCSIMQWMTKGNIQLLSLLILGQNR